MQQLTVVEYAFLMGIKEGEPMLPSSFVDRIISKLLSKGLIKESGDKYKIISGQRYNYRGNTYTL